MATSPRVKEFDYVTTHMLEDLTCFAEGISVAVKEHLRTQDTLLPSALFPIWRDAIHNVLRNYGCACDTMQCVLAQSDEMLRLKEFPKALCFDEFLTVFRAMRRGFERHLSNKTSN